MAQEKRSNKSYENLNMRQKSLIDAMALDRLDDEDRTRGDITFMAHDMYGEKQYAVGTVNKYQQRYPHIIEERVQVLANEFENDDGEGEVITTGDPMAKYTGPAEGLDGTMQNITERPVKSPDDSEDETGDMDTEEGETLFMLAMDEERMFRLIRSEDEELARWAFRNAVCNQ